MKGEETPCNLRSIWVSWATYFSHGERPAPCLIREGRAQLQVHPSLQYIHACLALPSNPMGARPITAPRILPLFELIPRGVKRKHDGGPPRSCHGAH